MNSHRSTTRSLGVALLLGALATLGLVLSVLVPTASGERSDLTVPISTALPTLPSVTVPTLPSVTVPTLPAVTTLPTVTTTPSLPSVTTVTTITTPAATVGGAVGQPPAADPAPAEAAGSAPPTRVPNTGPGGPGTKTARCSVVRGTHDRRCTPGAVRRPLSLPRLCRAGSVSEAVVSPAVRRTVLANYGIDASRARDYRLDRLVSANLGGASVAANVWPQPTSAKLGFRDKNRVEAYLHARVCAGKLSLAAAHRQLETQWMTLARRLAR